MDLEESDEGHGQELEHTGSSALGKGVLQVARPLQSPFLFEFADKSVNDSLLDLYPCVFTSLIPELFSLGDPILEGDERGVANGGFGTFRASQVSAFDFSDRSEVLDTAELWRVAGVEVERVNQSLVSRAPSLSTITSRGVGRQQIADVANERRGGDDDSKKWKEFCDAHESNKPVCRFGCLKHVREDVALRFRSSILELSKDEHDALIMGVAVSSTASESEDTETGFRPVKRTRGGLMKKRDKVAEAEQESREDATVPTEIERRRRFSFRFHGNRICRRTFFFLYAISERRWKNIVHFLGTSLVPGRRLHAGGAYHVIPPLLIHLLDRFLLNVAMSEGIPAPGRFRADSLSILLPASLSFASLHRLFESIMPSCIPRQNANSEGGQVLSSASFSRYVAAADRRDHGLPRIVISSPSRDCCEMCERYRAGLSNACRFVRRFESIQGVLREFSRHVELASFERDRYVREVRRRESRRAHIEFDWGFPIGFPHVLSLAGPFSHFGYGEPYRFETFVVSCAHSSESVIYCLAEADLIDSQSTEISRGANATISLLHDFFDRFPSFNQPNVVLHANNCVGQDRTRYLLGYLYWRVVSGLNDQIEIHFLQEGHTRTFGDACFACFKRAFRKMETTAIGQLADVVRLTGETASFRCQPVVSCVDSSQGRVIWRDWVSFLLRFVGAVPRMFEFCLFRIRAEGGGNVEMFSSLVRGEDGSAPSFRTSVLREGFVPEAILRSGFPRQLIPQKLSETRRKYLSDRVFPFVREEDRKILLNGSY